MVGHSFTHRLESFVDSRQDKDRDFDLQGVEVKYHAAGGCKIADVWDSFGDQLIERKPHIVVLAIGDNDVDRVASADGLGRYVAGIADKIREETGAKVAVSQIMPRYPARGEFEGRWPFSVSYNGKAAVANAALCDDIMNYRRGIAFWRHAFVAFPSQDQTRYDKVRDMYYSDDGVHLGPGGQCMLYKSYRQLFKGHALNNL